MSKVKKGITVGVIIGAVAGTIAGGYGGHEIVSQFISAGEAAGDFPYWQGWLAHAAGIVVASSIGAKIGSTIGGLLGLGGGAAADGFGRKPRPGLN